MTDSTTDPGEFLLVFRDFGTPSARTAARISDLAGEQARLLEQFVKTGLPGYGFLLAPVKDIDKTDSSLSRPRTGSVSREAQHKLRYARHQLLKHVSPLDLPDWCLVLDHAGIELLGDDPAPGPVEWTGDGGTLVTLDVMRKGV